LDQAPALLDFAAPVLGLAVEPCFPLPTLGPVLDRLRAIEPAIEAAWLQAETR
jgi:hypothetical protein